MKWKITVDHINVDAGDSTLVRVFNDQIQKTVLIDGGIAGAAPKRVLKFLKEATNVPKLNAVVVTHYDRDHLGGIEKLISGSSPLLENWLISDEKEANRTYFYDTGKLLNESKKGEKAEYIFNEYKRAIKNLKNKKFITHFSPFENADDALLGHELFWNQKVVLAKNFEESKDSLDANGMKNRPRLLCVSVNKITALSQPQTRDEKFWINDETTDINQRSIALLLISEKCEIVYYLAGDLGEDYEGQIVKWIGEQKNIPVIKFSHHGAKFSTPHKLITKYKPTHGIISAGGGSQCHPSMELLLFLADYNYGLNDLNKRLYICATNYPSYFRDLDRFKQAVNKDALKSLLDTLDKNKKIYESVKKYIEIKKTMPADDLSFYEYIKKEIWEYVSLYNKDKMSLPAGISGIPLRLNIKVDPINLKIESPPLNLPVTQKYDKKRKISVSSSDNRVVKYPKNPLFFSFLSATENPIYRIFSYSKVSQSDSNFIRLSQDCALDRFVAALGSQCITLRYDPDQGNPSQRDAKQTWTVSGEIIDTELKGSGTDYLARWIKQSLNEPVRIKISGNLLGKQDEWCINVEEKGVQGIQPPKIILKNSQLIFNLISDKDSTFQSISKRFDYPDNTQLIPLLENIFPEQQAPSISARFVFDPCGGWEYVNSLSLSLALPGPFKIGSMFSITDSAVIFNNRQRLNGISPEEIAYLHQYGVNMHTNINFGKYTLDADAQFQSNGLVYISFQLNDSVEEILLTILAALLSVQSDPLAPLKKMFPSINFPKMKIDFTLTYQNGFKLISLAAGFNLTLDSLDMELQYDFINNSIIGGLTDTTFSDDSIDANDEISKNSLAELLAVHKCVSPDQQLDSISLTNFSFLAQLPKGQENGYYQISANLRCDWKINSEIKFTDLSIQVSKEGKDISANLTAMLSLSTKVVLISLEHSMDGWTFDTQIDKFTIADLCSLFPKSVGDVLQTILPSKLTFNNSRLQIKSHQGAKEFFFNTTIPVGNVLCNIAFFCASDSKDPSASRHLLACDLVSPVFKNIPLVKKITLPLTIYWLSAKGTLREEDGIYFQSIYVIPPTLDITTLAGKSGLFLDINTLPKPLFLSTEGQEQKNSVVSSTGLSSVSPSSAPATPGSWININASIGPLSLERMGFAYTEGRLHVMLDGAVQLGPLQLKVLGLGVSFAFNSIENSHTHGFTLNGISFDYSIAGKLSLSGEFARILTDPDVVEFEGEVSMGMESFNIGAIGDYKKHKDIDQVSLFIFGRLQKALGGPPFFYVTGLSAGFGYNQSLRIPSQDEVVNFPLVLGAVDPMQLSDDLGEVLQLLLTPPTGTQPWLSSQSDNYWLTAGVDFTTFSVMGSRALVTVEFGRDLQIAIIGRSYLRFPQSGNFSVFNVEMGLEMVLKPDDGVFNMSAILSPNSYVLTPDCHLTGGFALYTWFKNQPGAKAGTGACAGDFVVTLGGYHPAFPAPAWYPQVPRLGFNWQVSDYVSIDGESYFALTPAAVMAGGHLQALFHCGGLKAWLKAGADFLIQWQPLKYDVEVGVSVGASYHLDLGFASVNLSAELGADLHIFGPPTQGKVHVDWFVISFTIPFPDPSPGLSVQPQSWDEFYKMLSSSALKQTTQDKSDTQFTFNKIILDSGLLRNEKEDQESKEQGSRWIVRPGQLRISCESAMPITDVAFEEASLLNGETSPDIYIKPMSSSDSPVKINSHTQRLKIEKIERDEKGPPAIRSEDISRWSYQLVKRNTPGALWGNPALDDSLSPDSSLVKNCITGVTLWPKPSTRTPTVASTVDVEKLREEDFPIQRAPLPLRTPLPADPVDKAGSPQSSTDCRMIIGSSIAAGKQQSLASKLSEIGLFRYKGPLDNMKNFAERAVNVLLEQPLLENR